MSAKRTVTRTSPAYARTRPGSYAYHCAEIHRCSVRCFPATARTLRGCCPANARMIRRTLRRTPFRTPHGNSADMDWLRSRSRLRTGHGLDAAADSVPDIRRNRLGRCPSVARTLAGYCPADARTSCQKLRGRFSGRYAGNPTGCGADIARLAALPSSKGMVSNQNDRLSHSRKPPKILFN